MLEFRTISLFDAVLLKLLSHKPSGHCNRSMFPSGFSEARIYLSLTWWETSLTFLVFVFVISVTSFMNLPWDLQFHLGPRLSLSYVYFLSLSV